MRRTKPLTLTAVLSALGVVVLYLTAVIPTGALGLCAVAGILPAVVFLECGFGWSVAHYAVTAALALLLVPDKTFVLWYVFALGHYGVWKGLIERLPSQIAQWALKLAVFVVSMGLLLWLFSAVFAAALPHWSRGVLYAALTVVFIVYDIGVTGVLAAYRRRIMGRHRT